MKKLLIFFSLLVILFSRSESVFAAYEGYVSAYEGYQLVLAQMESEFYDIANVKLVDVISVLNGSLDLGMGEETFDLEMAFEGDALGKSNYWIYTINYREDEEDNYMLAGCIVMFGQPFISITPIEEDEEEGINEAQRFLNLTPESDSPIFVKKLVETTNFIEEIPAKDDETRASYIAFSYIELEDVPAGIQIQEDIPYWAVGINDETADTDKVCILLADDNIANNEIECFEMIYTDEDDENESILENNNIDIAVYPNPAIENINITIPSEYAANVSSIQLFDVNGSLLDNINTYNYNAANLANGTYYICFTINNCKYYRSFIINK